MLPGYSVDSPDTYLIDAANELQPQQIQIKYFIENTQYVMAEVIENKQNKTIYNQFILIKVPEKYDTKQLSYHENYIVRLLLRKKTNRTVYEVLDDSRPFTVVSDKKNNIRWSTITANVLVTIESMHKSSFANKVWLTAKLVTEMPFLTSDRTDTIQILYLKKDLDLLRKKQPYHFMLTSFLPSKFTGSLVSQSIPLYQSIINKNNLVSVY
ncbi:MAG: hypothetical protein HAW62_02330 [Endozoicomonadaceae bacterium]|nr:hypothetical protein [Endozoicomonadaceae bacterium]